MLKRSLCMIMAALVLGLVVTWGGVAKAAKFNCGNGKVNDLEECDGVNLAR